MAVDGACMTRLFVRFDKNIQCRSAMWSNIDHRETPVLISTSVVRSIMYNTLLLLCYC